MVYRLGKQASGNNVEQKGSGGALSYFIWTQCVSEQIDTRVWGEGRAERRPFGSLETGYRASKQTTRRSGPVDH